ncbi:MAG: hypothetical protein ACI9EF_002962 [Pseudohongiellaceae bacterium]|jgi:hypothetical protein
MGSQPDSVITILDQAAVAPSSLEHTPASGEWPRVQSPLLLSLLLVVLWLAASCDSLWAQGSSTEPPQSSSDEGAAERLAALSQVSAALARDTSLSDELRDALAALMTVLEREAREPSVDLADELRRLALDGPPAPQAPGALSLPEGLRVSGDLRLRHETRFSQDDAGARNRDRVRLRLGAEYAINDELNVAARLVTGARGDPNSTHQTLGSVFDI